MGRKITIYIIPIKIYEGKQPYGKVTLSNDHSQLFHKEREDTLDLLASKRDKKKRKDI